jgi:hypothetical protein
MKFDHIGLITDKKQGEEDWVEDTKVWVTNPKKHPFNIEWLRFREDSPLKGDIREKSHIAFRVDNLEEASKGLTVLIKPFIVGGFVKSGFYRYSDGAIVELMEYLKGNEQWFNKK